MEGNQKEQLKELRAEMTILSQTIKEAGLPVLVLVEGYAAAGKGTLISYLIRDLDPRNFKVITTKKPTKEEKRKPFLYRHMLNIPEKGKLVFLDSGWMNEVVEEAVKHPEETKAYEQKIESIRIFERQLVDNGYLVLKIFLDISEKEQKKRIEKLAKDKNTSWRVGNADEDQVKHHAKYEEAFNRYLRSTNIDDAPWHFINMGEEKEVEFKVCSLLVDEIHRYLEKMKVASVGVRKKFPLIEMSLLKDVDLNQTISDEEYEKELKKCQKRIGELQNELYRKKIPVIIGYEGWDAAGKGGNIKRLTSGMDARGFEVHPIAAPEPHEKNRMYLWRFWKRLPKTGHIAVFDRTWYGRVMVERLEGFCGEKDWKRAYTEINEFEQELVNWGAVVMKFWIHIDKDTQLARFNDRKNNPEKSWKLTDEDWRNRDKWDEYEEAVNEMLQKTSTEAAPWYIIESNDKHYARIKVLHLVIDALEKRLKG